MNNHLSPTAQAVLDAATNVKHPEIEAVAFQCTRLEVAAALRAAADQVVPSEYELVDGHLQYEKQNSIREAFLAIVAELENHAN